MQPITATENEIVIPFETAIALYEAGYIYPALLGYCLPVSIAVKECPQVLEDKAEIEHIALMMNRD